MKKSLAGNRRFAEAGVSCSPEADEVLNSSFVHLMKFSAQNPRFRQAAKPLASWHLPMQIANTLAAPVREKKVGASRAKSSIPGLTVYSPPTLKNHALVCGSRRGLCG